MDLFSRHESGLESPATRLQAIEPDDVATLPLATRAISVAETGFVRVTTVHGDTGAVFVVAGVPFGIRAQKVWATGTTATGIMGLA